MVHIHFKWVPRHEGITGNEMADELAKATSEGTHSAIISLPPILRDPLPVSTAALEATKKTKVIPRWTEAWKIKSKL